MAAPVTVGELDRRLTALQVEVNNSFAALSKKIDDKDEAYVTFHRNIWIAVVTGMFVVCAALITSTAALIIHFLR